MRRTSIVLTLLAVLVGIALVLFLTQEAQRGAVATGLESADPQEAAVPAAAARNDALDAVSVANTALQEPARTEVSVPATTAEVAPTCVVIGRIVDDQDAPLASAEVRLYAYKVWTNVVDVPRLEGPLDFRGFQVASTATGEFRVEAPVPTATRPALAIRPDRFHDSYTVYFATTGNSVEPPLVAGVRDMGVIRLARTGALVGRVLDAQGMPLADMDVGIGPTPSQTFGRNVRSNADGSYVVAHAPVGTYGVFVNGEKFISHFEPDLKVEAGRDTPVKDIVLAPAPTLEGIVRDERGQPLAGAKLWGWPKSSGRGAGGTCGADGRFTLYLPQNEPYSFTVKLEGYLPWGDEHDRTVGFEPGQRDIEIVMQPLARTRFAVVDDRTGEPILRFGLNILENNGSRSPTNVYTERRPPQQLERAGGIAEAGGRVGIDLFVIAAEGYQLETGDVEHDAEGSTTQTVRMRRSPSVRGRVLRDGAALANTVVETIEIRDPNQHSEQGPGSAPYHAESNTRRSTRTDDEGRFEVFTLAAADHRVAVRPDVGAPLVLQPIVVAGGPLDLGDLHVLPGATILGQLLLPAGIDPTALVVYLDERFGNVTAIVDGAGRFRFENVPAGVRFVAHHERAGELDEGEPVRVEVAAGETKSVTIDARDRAMCVVDLRIDLGELAARGVHVMLVAADDAGVSTTLGSCDAEGRVRGSVRGFGAARVRVWLPDSRIVEHPTALLQLTPLGQVEADVRFEFTRLDVKLPPNVERPRDGTIRVRIGSGEHEQVVVLKFANAAPIVQLPTLGVNAGELSIGGLIAGSTRVTVEFVDAAAEPEVIAMEDGRSRWEPRAYFSSSADVQLIAGRTTKVELK